MDREIWEESGFASSVRALYEFAKDEGVKVTQKEVKEFLARQRSVQVLRQPRRPKHFDTIWASRPDFQWQVDVTFPPRAYGSYKAILMLVDVYSRRLAAVPVTSREQTNTLFPAFQTAIEELGSKRGYPDNINGDNEFNTKSFLLWGKRHGVNWYFSNADEADFSTKQSIVERMNGTLLRRLEAFGRASGRLDWPKYLRKVVDRLNQTTQRTIKGKPSLVYTGEQPNLQTVTRIKNRFKAGQRVRLRLKRETFQKGSTAQNYSDEIYVLVRQDDSKRNRWWLRDVETEQLLPRPYAERDLSIIYGIDEEPNVVRAAEKERVIEDKSRPARNFTRRERNRLKDDSTLVPQRPAQAKRQAAKPARFRESS
jgi:hypothetical protein